MVNLNTLYEYIHYMGISEKLKEIFSKKKKKKETIVNNKKK